LPSGAMASRGSGNLRFRRSSVLRWRPQKMVGWGCTPPRDLLRAAGDQEEFAAVRTAGQHLRTPAHLDRLSDAKRLFYATAWTIESDGGLSAGHWGRFKPGLRSFARFCLRMRPSCSKMLWFWHGLLQNVQAFRAYGKGRFLS
jgi:hypothetical protein